MGGPSKIKSVESAVLLAQAVVCSLLLVIAGCSGKAESTRAAETQQFSNSPKAEQQAKSNVPRLPRGDALKAKQKAAEAGRYLFAFFYKADDEKNQAMWQVVEGTVKKASDRADAVAVDISDPSAKSVVDEYGLDRAPMPLALAIAPNGAITGGFPTEFQEKVLLDAFASPCMAKCMKSLHDGKLVFLCVQNDTTKLNDEAMRGVSEFKSDARFGQATEIVKMNPGDSAEASFLAGLKIEKDTKNAVTVFLAPPGSPIAMYEGATSKDELVATLLKAGSGCGPGGCGPGGCGPRK